MKKIKVNANKAVTAGLGYTVGNILVKGINFLAIPVFGRIMTTQELGSYSVFAAYDAILFIFVGMALHSSIKSAKYEFNNQINEYTSSVSLVYIINAIILMLVSLLFGQVFSRILNINIICLFLLIAHSFSSAILGLYNSRISLDYSYKRYLIIALLNSAGNVTLSLILILSIFREQKDIGRIVGVTVVLFAIAIYVLYDLYRRAKPAFNRIYWKFGIKYSLPIIPHGVSQVLLAQFDRIMISRLVSDSAAGIYSLVGNIKMILTIITESISTAWGTWFFEEIDKGNREIIQKKSVQLCALFTILAVGLMALSPEVVYIFGGAKYDQGKYVAVPMIMDAFILFLYNIIVPAEYYTKKTVYIMAGTMMAAVLNVILNYFFILKYGFIAAAYTTLAAYSCYLALHVIIAYRLVKFHVLPLKMMFLYIGIVAVCGILNLVFISSVIIRYAMCALVVIPMAAVLLKKTDILSKVGKK